MKRKVALLTAMLSIGAFAFAQDGTVQKGKQGAQREITYKSQAEKNKSISEQEQRLKVNSADPTYPKDLLEKEKQQLELSKKAKINK